MVSGVGLGSASHSKTLKAGECLLISGVNLEYAGE